MGKYTEKEIHEIMQDEFGFKQFKCETQKKTVFAVLNGDKNIIVSMATNSGKSLCFQLPSLLQRDGIILVISPNLSLLENQMRYLNKLGLRAKSINSTNRSQTDRRKIREELMDDDTLIKFFYLCPEMAATDYYTEFLHDLLNDGLISHVVIDEAHCLVDKGYRTSFSKLKEFRQEHENVPFIALTTASDDTIKEIENALGMTDTNIIKSSSVKDNIVYDVWEVKDDEEINFMKFFESIAPDFGSLKAKEMPTGIIYCATTIDIEKTMKALADLKVPATSFHAQNDKRFDNYDDWMGDKYAVMVASTESFGLGIVKPFVKFVVHINIPRNLRAYYQESGRAGLNGDRAFSRIYYRKSLLRLNPLMSKFITSTQCRRQLIAEFFGEKVAVCHIKCDNCKTNEVTVPLKKLRTQ